MPILDAVRKFFKSLQMYRERQQDIQETDADHFLEQIFHYFPFTAQAQQWIRTNIRLELVAPDSITGGGGWYPNQRMVRFNTTQYEAAIHELAHAVWHEKRRERRVRDGLVAAVHRLAEDTDPRWAGVHTIAGHYIHGIASQPGFEHGMLLSHSEWGTGGGPQGEWNDWEMFAGLASGCRADIRLLPPYLRTFYTDLFTELPPDAPSPASLAPHN